VLRALGVSSDEERIMACNCFRSDGNCSACRSSAMGVIDYNPWGIKSDNVNIPIVFDRNINAIKKSACRSYNVCPNKEIKDGVSMCKGEIFCEYRGKE
jgi:hypothetical protein